MAARNFVIFNLLALLAMGTQVIRTSTAAPKPAFVPPEGTWQLDLELHGPPQKITVALPGNPEPKRFWYLLYTISNHTGRDVEFFPKIDLITDTLLLHHAGEHVRQPVFEAVRKRYAKTIPFLEPEEKVAGLILQTRDNARDTVAIFEDFDPNATEANIFISGLSNETIALELPFVENKTAPTKKKVLLQKSLMLKYSISGDRYHPEDRIMLYKERDWIMR